MSGTADHSILENLGRRIRNTRVANGMSQAALARLCGITFQQVQKYETGRTRIPIDRLVSLAAALDLPVTELVRDLDQEPLVEADEVPSRSQKQAVALLKHFNAIADEKVRASLLALIKNVGTLERTAPAGAEDLLAPDGGLAAALDGAQPRAARPEQQHQGGRNEDAADAPALAADG